MICEKEITKKSGLRRICFTKKSHFFGTKTKILKSFFSLFCGALDFQFLMVSTNSLVV